MTDKAVAIQRKAKEVFVAEKTDWSTFFGEVLGVNGIVHQMYPDPESRAEFEKTPAYAELQQMLKQLRERNGQRASTQDITRVITVRLPKALHEALKSEAFRRETSMNQLCISKLLLAIEEGATSDNEAELVDEEHSTEQPTE